jgi:hypothetical protein
MIKNISILLSMLIFCIGVSYSSQQIPDSFNGSIKDTTTSNIDKTQSSNSDNTVATTTKDSKLANGESVEEHVKKINDIADKHYEEFLLKAEKMVGDKAHIDKKTGYIDDAADDSVSKTTKIDLNKNPNDRPQVDHYYDNGYTENLGDVDMPIDTDGDLDANDEDYKDKLNDGYLLKQITTVGLINKNRGDLNKCLKMKAYGRGTWQTYCQPVKQPKECLDKDWKKLSTMALMYC